MENTLDLTLPAIVSEFYVLGDGKFFVWKGQGVTTRIEDADRYARRRCKCCYLPDHQRNTSIANIEYIPLPSKS